MFGLIIKSKKKYNVEFKLRVIKYYQNHEMGTSKVAALFNLDVALVERWKKEYNTFGISRFMPKRKGRPRKYMKNYKRTNNNDNKDQKIKELEQQLHKTELERDCLKALQDMRLSQIEKNPD